MGTKQFSERLIAWQRLHGRHDLPWQGADAYRVWLSEIMLQQTQVSTVIPYYQRFIAAFPDIAALAAATEDEVLTHWSGLGYYARGRNLLRAARIIAEKYQGEFPRDFEQLLELPGIGRSTAAAICALAYHERRAILDGNVKRVLARYCGIAGWTGDKKVETELWQQAESLLPLLPGEGWGGGGNGADCHDMATYTQALMDMGATICTRSKPKCTTCPVHNDCVAYQTQRVGELPTPRPKKTLPEKQACLLLLMSGRDILLEKRPPVGIWGGLWSLPQFDDEAIALNWCAYQGVTVASKASMPVLSHTFTHFKLHISPLRVDLQRKPQAVMTPGVMWIDADDALRAAIPTPVRRLIAGLH